MARLVQGNRPGLPERVWFKVPPDAPSEFTEVSLPEALVGTDGLILFGTDHLLAIMNQASGQTPNRIARLRSDDGWSGATIEVVFARFVAAG